MFKPNKRHLQPFLITNINDIQEKHRKLLENSWAATFYRELFCRLKEEPFAGLFVDHPSERIRR